MADIRKFPSPGMLGRDLRTEYGLTSIQATAALGISEAELEELEGRVVAPAQLERMRSAYEVYSSVSGSVRGVNMIFGYVPLRRARDMVQLTLEEIATAHGFTAEKWSRFEDHSDAAPKEVLQAVEELVRESFVGLL